MKDTKNKFNKKQKIINELIKEKLDNFCEVKKNLYFKYSEINKNMDKLVLISVIEKFFENEKILDKLVKTNVENDEIDTKINKANLNNPNFQKKLNKIKNDNNENEDEEKLIIEIKNLKNKMFSLVSDINKLNLKIENLTKNTQQPIYLVQTDLNVN